MFGLGKKDADGKQIRIEHRGKFTRASRTGGVSLRAEKALGPVNLTANTSRGIRASSRITRGARIALQNGRVQLIGRWRAGPLGINLSKTGMSVSVKNSAGTFNYLKPRYSSFKVAGIQVRGKKAAQLHMVYLVLSGIAALGEVGVRAAIWLFWGAMLPVLFLWDVGVGLLSGVSSEPDDPSDPRDIDAI